VLTAFCIVILLGFVALAVDVGLLFRWRRNLQIVADAAATAGALDYYQNGLGTSGATSANKAATNAINANFGSGVLSAPLPSCPVTPGSTLQGCVSIPPSSGVHAGNGFVEVQLVQPRRTTFMSYFGFGTVNVATRAVAGITTGQACIWVKKDLNVQASAGLCGIDPANASTWISNNSKCRSGGVCPATGEILACGVYVGGNISSNGSSNCIASQYVVTPGTVSASGQGLNPSPAISGAPTQDPPAWLMATPPAPQNCTMPTNGPNSSISSTVDNKGVTVYTATISNQTISGCIGFPGDPGNSVLNLTLQNVTLANTNSTIQFNLGSVTVGNGSNTVPGGTLTLGSNVCNYCSGPPVADPTTGGYPGTTLELYTGNFSVLSTSTGINLYAPNDTTAKFNNVSTNGIALWEPPSNVGNINIQWGSATSSFYGYIVAPGASLSMQDQGGKALVSGLYVGNMDINSELGIVNYNAAVSNAPGKTIALVE
jgi:hypothetical protein